MLLSTAVSAFEAAWRTGESPDPAAFLMPAPKPLRLRTLIELLKVDLEYRWEREDRQGIEEYLERWPELESPRPICRELLEAECVTRSAFGWSMGWGELRRRFPELAEEIDLESIQQEVAREG